MKKYSEDVLEEAKYLVKSYNEWIDNDFPEAPIDPDPDIANKNKKDDDFKFDSFFNDSMRNRYFEPEDVFWGDSFWFFQQNINGLYLYYQYLRRFINFYTGEALKFYEHQRAVMDVASGLPFSPDFYDYEEEIELTESINQIEYENIVMALYRVFERFLKEYIQEYDPNSAVLREAKGDHTVLDYMKHLKKQRIFVPRELYEEFTKLRLLRNHFVHSNDSIQNYLRTLLEKDTHKILQEDHIIINNDYIESAFQTICSIVKCIELFEASRAE